MKSLIPMLLASSLLAAELPELTLMDLSPCHMEQMEKGDLQCIVQIEEGDEIPLNFTLTGDVIAFKSLPENGNIVALRPFYIQVDRDEFLFSLDKEKWLPPGEFFTGNLFVGVGTSVEPFGMIGLHTDVR